MRAALLMNFGGALFVYKHIIFTVMQFIKVKNYEFDCPLSGNFKLGEFIQSNVAFQNKLVMQYVHQDAIVDNLAFLCDALLQPIRDEFGSPIRVTSGYRCSMLNQMVGGVKNSLHLQGLAADLVAPGRMYELARVIQHHRFHQCFIYNNYIHVSIKQIWNENRYSNFTNDILFDFGK